MSKLLLTAVCVCSLLVAASAPAAIIPVDLQLLLPSNDVNTLQLTLMVDLMGSDSGAVTLTGNVLADLTINFQPVTLEADAVGLELTGGMLTASDAWFMLDFGLLIGSIQASLTHLRGTPDTPAPPGPVTGGTFPGGDHVVIFNGGDVHVSGTGLIGGLFDPIAFDLAAYPIATSTNQPGWLAVSAPAIDGDLATYVVTLTQPVALSEQIIDIEGVVVTIDGSGTLQATGEFTIPEPATLLLLSAGGFALVLRRRRAAGRG